MRLTPAQIDTIQSTVHAVLGDGAVVSLFGSRLDDSRRGGDVDLLIEAQVEKLIPMAVQGLGELASHHIALAAPKRLIVFGVHILPLLGHDPANNPANSAQINHGSPITPLPAPMLAVRDLAVLLERPRWKAAATAQAEYAARPAHCPEIPFRPPLGGRDRV